MPDRGYRVVSCQACQCKNRNGVKAFHNIPAHLRSLRSWKTLGAWLANCLHREAPRPSQLCYCQTQPISLSNEAVVKASESLQSDHERLHYISLLCLYVCLVLGCITLTLQQSWSEYVWMTNIRVLPLFWRTRIHLCAKWSDKRIQKIDQTIQPKEMSRKHGGPMTWSDLPQWHWAAPTSKSHLQDTSWLAANAGTSRAPWCRHGEKRETRVLQWSKKM